MPEGLNPDQAREIYSLVKLLHLKGKKNTFQLKGSKSLINERKSDYSQTLTAKLSASENAVAFSV